VTASATGERASGADRIAAAFADSGKRAALMPYLMGGHPDLETSRACLHAAVDAGADLIELGIPFSDPLADGPVIHAAGNQALEAGVKPPDVLALGKEIGRPGGDVTLPQMPAGLESVNTRLAIAERAAVSPDDSRWDHVEMRDNRSEAFAMTHPEGSHRFAYTARATTPGTFIAAPSKAEEMYSPETFGRSAGTTVTIE